MFLNLSSVWFSLSILNTQICSIHWLCWEKNILINSLIVLRIVPRTMLRDTKKPSIKLGALGNQSLKKFFRFKDSSKQTKKKKKNNKKLYLFVCPPTPVPAPIMLFFYELLVWSVCWWKLNMQTQEIWLFTGNCIWVSTHYLFPSGLGTMLAISNKKIFNLLKILKCWIISERRMATQVLVQTEGTVSPLFSSEL